MSMRKLPPGMDYYTIRHNYPPGRKDQPRRAGNKNAPSEETAASPSEPATESAETAEQEETTPAASAPASPEPSDAAAPREESEPNAEASPEPAEQEEATAIAPAPDPSDTSERTGTQEAPEPSHEPSVKKGGAKEADAPSQPAQRASKATVSRARKPDRPIAASGEGAEQVAMVGYIQIPAEGAFESFDELARIYGVRDAFGFAMTAALKDFDDAIVSGQHIGQVPAYTSRKGRLSVRRTISDAAYRRAVATIDPRGLMGSWQVTSRIFRTALALHLAKDGPAGISSRAS